MIHKFRRAFAGRALFTSWVFIGTLGAAPQQKQEPIPVEEPLPSPSARRKQTQDLLKANFEKMKRDADQLTALVKSLQEDLSNSNENMLSLKIVGKAEKIEKLAKKIKETAKGC